MAMSWPKEQPVAKVSNVHQEVISGELFFIDHLLRSKAHFHHEAEVSMWKIKADLD